MLSDLKRAAWTDFYAAHAQITREIDRKLTEAGVVNIESYAVLERLEDAPAHRLRMNELADGVGYSRSGITRLVDRLQGEGWVERVPCPGDRRAMHCFITRAGLAERSRAWPVYSQAIDELFGSHLTDMTAAAIQRIFAEMRS